MSLQLHFLIQYLHHEHFILRILFLLHPSLTNCNPGSCSHLIRLSHFGHMLLRCSQLQWHYPCHREGIRYQVPLDLLIQRCVTGKGSRQVGLQKPNFQLFVNKHIEALHLKAVVLVDDVLCESFVDVVFSAEKGLNDDFINLVTDESGIDIKRAEVLPQGGETPLRPDIIFVCICVFNEIGVLLVDRIVGQMRVSGELVDVLSDGLVLNSSESDQPFLIDVESKRVN